MQGRGAHGLRAQVIALILVAFSLLVLDLVGLSISRLGIALFLISEATES